MLSPHRHEQRVHLKCNPSSDKNESLSNRDFPSLGESRTISPTRKLKFKSCTLVAFSTGDSSAKRLSHALA